MNGPEHHPDVPNSARFDPQAPPHPLGQGYPMAPGAGFAADPWTGTPQGCGDPATQPSFARRTHDGSHITYPGDAGYPAAPARHHGSAAVRPDDAPHPAGQADTGGLQPLLRMPGNVRAAQVICWIGGGIGVLLVAALIAADRPEAAGAAIAGFLPFLFLAILAFGFTSGANGIRMCTIAIACLQALCGFGSISQPAPPGLLGTTAGAAIAILLARQSAREWFTRPH
ncbi:hypothetical protein [Nocardia fluminea]|uniref:hypothetical protein n=1 Tax=Nocardia fluminea TaxID=134984 RepID=UPI0033E7D810